MGETGMDGYNMNYYNPKGRCAQSYGYPRVMKEVQKREDLHHQGDSFTLSFVDRGCGLR